MVVDHFQHGLRSQQAQITVLLVRVNDLKHPEDRVWIYDIFLIRSVMLDVEVDYIEELIEDPPVFRVKQGLENVHEKLLVEFVKDKLALIQLIVKHVHRQKALFFFCQLLCVVGILAASVLILHTLRSNRWSGPVTFRIDSSLGSSLQLISVNLLRLRHCEVREVKMPEVTGCLLSSRLIRLLCES